jgi:nitrogen fixation/metabolism regulation signal transduction histidine kinase
VAPSKRYKRSQYLIDRGLQLRFTKFMVLFVFASCVFTGLTIFYTIYTMLGERLEQVYPQGQLVAIFRSVHIAFFFDLLLILPFIFYNSILFSHRFAGPLPKIYHALRCIGNGQFDVKLILRKKDELRELADVINETAAKLREREKSGQHKG